MKQTSQTSRRAERARRSGLLGRIGVAGRIGAAAAAASLTLTVSACGFNVQTLQPYTPSDGVNVNVAPGPDGNPDPSTIKVRGLMILAKSPTSGFLSATLVAQNDDTLTGVTGNVLKPDGSNGDQLTVTLATPIKVGGSQAVVLVNSDPVTVKGSSLPTGQDAYLTLTFAKAGAQQVKVPIVDGNNDVYATVQPSAPATTS